MIFASALAWLHSEFTVAAASLGYAYRDCPILTGGLLQLKFADRQQAAGTSIL